MSHQLEYFFEEEEEKEASTIRHNADIIKTNRNIIKHNEDVMLEDIISNRKTMSLCLIRGRFIKGKGRQGEEGGHVFNIWKGNCESISKLFPHLSHFGSKTNQKCT